MFIDFYTNQFILFYLGHSKKMKVAYIDHVGADLIATELRGLKRKIAVSVKGRIFKDISDKAFRFDMDNQKKLRKTTKDFGNDYIPVISFVAVDNVGDNTVIRIIIGVLDQFIKLQNDKTCDFVTDGYSTIDEETKIDGFNFHIAEKYISKIKACNCLEYTELIFPNKILIDKKSTEMPAKKFLDFTELEE